MHVIGRLLPDIRSLSRTIFATRRDGRIASFLNIGTQPLR